MKNRSLSLILPSRPDLQHEIAARAAGYEIVIGVDEAGRGPLAGPVVAGAVCLSAEISLATWPDLNDSKQLNAQTRARLFQELTARVTFGIGIVEAAEIDRINIRQASWLAMQNAVADLLALTQSTLAKEVAPPFVLIDGLGYGPGPWPYQALVKGDARCLSIAAASIIAKETRDALMIRFAAEFPEYGFARHKGYPTREHLRALEEHGPCALHRRSYAPVRRVCEQFGCD
jgi:ribonuclease HII